MGCVNTTIFENRVIVLSEAACEIEKFLYELEEKYNLSDSELAAILSDRLSVQINYINSTLKQINKDKKIDSRWSF